MINSQQGAQRQAAHKIFHILWAGIYRSTQKHLQTLDIIELSDNWLTLHELVTEIQWTNRNAKKAVFIWNNYIMKLSKHVLRLLNFELCERVLTSPSIDHRNLKQKGDHTPLEIIWGLTGINFPIKRERRLKFSCIFKKIFIIKKVCPCRNKVNGTNHNFIDRGDALYFHCF